jgi:hypothetical protein
MCGERETREAKEAGEANRSKLKDRYKLKSITFTLETGPTPRNEFYIRQKNARRTGEGGSVSPFLRHRRKGNSDHGCNSELPVQKDVIVILHGRLGVAPPRIDTLSQHLI